MEHKMINPKIFSIIICSIFLFQVFSVHVISQPQRTTQSELVTKNGFDLLIISTEKYQDVIQPLINHKNRLGITTILRTTNEIYDSCAGRDSPEKIKFFIKEMKENSSITYVLFIGDIEDIPSRYTHIYFDEPFDYPTPDEWVFPSDFYYADLYNKNGSFSSWDTNQNDIFAEFHWNGKNDDFDLTPDIYIGRLACTNEEQVRTCINKIIYYEENKIWSKNWFSNLVLIAGDGIPYDEENIIESEYLQEQIIDIMDGFIPNCVWASNGRLNNAYNINDAIEEGAGFVFFNGHGFHDLWGTYLPNSNILVPPGCYRTDHINELSNLEQLPIVISDACYHLQYDKYPNCFGWSFVANPNGGSIAFIGGSDTDLAYAGTRIVEKGIEKFDLKFCTLYQQGVTHLGDLWGQALIDYQPGLDDLVDIITILENHLFGDPSLQIAESHSLPPLQPDPPIGINEGKIRVDYNFTAVTTDPDGDELYYLFDFGDESISEWIGPISSGIECVVTHSWTKKGSYEIKVKAKDSTGLMSEWSEPTPISMPKFTIINYLESFHYRNRVNRILSQIGYFILDYQEKND